MGRIQSPSSISTYLQCARKYYYHYIAELPTKPSVPMLRGNVAHEVLEKFFDFELDDPNYRPILQRRLLELFLSTWNAYLPRLKSARKYEDLDAVQEETQLMMLNWLGLLCEKLEKNMALGPREAFRKIKPLTEQKFISEELKVQGYIDAIEHHPHGVRIMDYKTSKSPEMTDAYRLQLSIYALLYKDKYGEVPKEIGIYFLGHGGSAHEKIFPVEETHLTKSKEAIEFVHSKTDTMSRDDYPKTITTLCKWCDFYKHCFTSKLTDYIST